MTDEFVTLEKLTEVLGGFRGELTTELTKHFDGFMGRISQETKAQQKTLTNFETSLKSLSEGLPTQMKSTLTDLLAEIETEEPSRSSTDITTASPPTGKTEPDQSQKQLQDALSQIKKLTNRVTVAEQTAEQERLKQTEQAKQGKINAMRDDFIAKVEGTVATGKARRLFTLLKEEGLIQEDAENGIYMIKGKDNYGDDALIDIKAALPDLLKKDYSEFAPARGGSGSGATTTGASSSPSPSPKYIKEGMTNDEILALAQDDSVFNKVLAEAKALA